MRNIKDKINKYIFGRKVKRITIAYKLEGGTKTFMTVHNYSRLDAINSIKELIEIEFKLGLIDTNEFNYIYVSNVE